MVFEKSGKIINAVKNEIFIDTKSGNMDHFTMLGIGVWKNKNKQIIKDDGDCLESKSNKIMYREKYACDINGVTYSKIGTIVTSSNGEIWTNVKDEKDFKAILIINCC